MELTTRRMVAFATVLILAAFTRELTALMLWFGFVVFYLQKWQWSIGYLVLVFGILCGLRLLIPAELSPYTIGYTWELNTTDWRLQGAILFQALLLPLWILLFHQARGEAAKRIGLLLLPYLLLIAVLGVWQEVRLLMPILILGIPLSRRVFNG